MSNKPAPDSITPPMDTTYLDAWRAISTRKEAIAKYALLQQATMERKATDDISAINRILIEKFGMKGLNSIKRMALRAAGLDADDYVAVRAPKQTKRVRVSEK